MASSFHLRANVRATAAAKAVTSGFGASADINVDMQLVPSEMDWYLKISHQFEAAAETIAIDPMHTMGGRTTEFGDTIDPDTIKYVLVRVASADGANDSEIDIDVVGWAGNPFFEAAAGTVNLIATATREDSIIRFAPSGLAVPGSGASLTFECNSATGANVDILIAGTDTNVT